MKSSEIFALLVRVTGLINLILLLSEVQLLITSGFHWFYLLKFVVWIGLTVWLLRGAPALVRFAYPKES